MDLLKKIMGEMTYKEGNIEELLPNTADSRKSVSPHPNMDTFGFTNFNNSSQFSPASSAAKKAFLLG